MSGRLFCRCGLWGAGVPISWCEIAFAQVTGIAPQPMQMEFTRMPVYANYAKGIKLSA
jgi:hypothetical protein